MAAAIKAVNAKIRSNKVLDYICSTHFWGPVSNFVSPAQMTGALVIYSGTFMRYALAVTPKNYLLFACHFVNFGAQLTQGYRYLNWWNWGGRDAAIAAGRIVDTPKSGTESAADSASGAAVASGKKS
ncbi:predicted protein [Histoplasma mississippiense (nom. inval.)]|uniref:predicted protein n=1 Tax=Ajellomyces capsulatus (strain NAm1 / WU24) TaxID=2059318 RepID=UPI000157C3F0|nr:predicted protein [Histoplasma mississippiense (nom. inval.)]EDN07723.1 predicted protein [Histoplasma mississippiense (nom. inval.)]